MKITKVETYIVSAGWKNWLFVKVLTDSKFYGIGEATLNGFAKTTEAAIHELKHLVIGKDPCQVRSIAKTIISTVQDAGHIHRMVMAALEVACWDILGKYLGVPVHQLLGGKLRDSILAYANGWYQTERIPEDFAKAAEEVVSKGFRAIKLDPFGTAQGFIDEANLELAYKIVEAIRKRVGPYIRIMIDVHIRFTPSEAIRIAGRLAALDIFWWEEPTTPEREQLTCEVAKKCPIPVATGERFDKVGQFATLALGEGVSIWQPEPMSLGGILSTIAVANLAEANGCWVAPHQSGGPVQTVVCLHLAACIPNFLILEHFDPFNEPWTQELVTWKPEINQNNGHLPIPNNPGLGVDLNMDIVSAHPYNVHAYLDIHQEDWEKRTGTAGREGNLGI